MHKYLEYPRFLNETNVYLLYCITLVQAPTFRVKSVNVPLPLKAVLWGAFVSAENSLEENSNYMTMFFFIFFYHNSKEMYKSHMSQHHL